MAPLPLRKSGLEPVGDVPWGTHMCYFFETAEELIEAAVSFFAAGVEQGERCVWLIADPVLRESAVAALNGLQVEVLDAREWYGGGTFTDESVAAKGDQFLAEARRRGFTGLRVCGCQTWQRAEDWEAFRRYEASHDKWLPGKEVLFLCFYPLGGVGAIDVLEVVRNHHIAIARRNGQWKVLHTPDTTALYARTLQQAAVAALGQTAIRERDLSLVMREAVELAARTLATGRGLVWQLAPEHDRLIQRARAGWGDELPIDATVRLLPGSASGYVIEHDGPVIVLDLRTDPRFERSWLLREHEIVTMISAAIRSRDRPWGILTVHSKTRRDFTDDDVGFLQSMANVLALAIERDESERAERAKHELVLTIFDHMPVMISVWDPALHIVTVNRAWEKCLGYSAEEARAIDLATMHLDGESWERTREQVRTADRGWHDVRVRKRDGEILETTWARFRLSDGTTLSFGIDITERKQIEEAREEARATAEAALAKLNAIEKITDSVLAQLGLDELLSELLSRLRQALHADQVLLLLLDEERRHFHVRATNGAWTEQLLGADVPITSPVAGRVMQEMRAMTFPEVPPFDAPEWQGWTGHAGVDLESAMSAPVIVRGTFIGAVSVASSERREFMDDELDLLRLVVDRVAPAIERGRLIEQIRASEKQLEQLSRRLLTVQEEERRHIAVELHDQLGQIYTAAKIKLDSVRQALDGNGLAAQVGDAIEIVESAAGTVRDLALELRPAMLDDLGLAAALRWYADRFASQTGVRVHLAIDEFPGLDPALATVCFRVAQEALTNAARHASAHNVWLDVHSVDGHVQLTVRDDGVGFSVGAARARAVRGESLGLLGMAERLSYTSGTLRVESAPGAGTTINATVPLSKQDAL